MCKDGRVKRSPVQGILAAVILATVSLLTNLQSPEDLSVVDVQPLLVTRLVLSYLTNGACLLYTSPSPRDRQKSRMPSSA